MRAAIMWIDALPYICPEGGGIQRVGPFSGSYLYEYFVLERDVAEGKFAFGAAAGQEFGDVLLEPQMESEPGENRRSQE